MLYSEDDQNTRTLLVPDMTKICQYQTKEEEGQYAGLDIYVFKYYIVWSKDIEFKINLSAGWSMISLPVVPQATTPSILFPEAAVIYRFQRGAGYVRIQDNEELQIGTGYWILVYEDQNYVLTGQPIPSYNKTIYGSGWEMIGGCSSDAKALVDECKIKVIYGFERGSGYIRVQEGENLTPGKGYWILLEDIVDQCVLTVDATDPNIS